MLGWLGGIQWQIVQGIDTMWILFAAMLVIFMQAGFAMLEAGAIRSKNIRSILLKVPLQCHICSLPPSMLLSGPPTSLSSVLRRGLTGVCHGGACGRTSLTSPWERCATQHPEFVAERGCTPSLEVPLPASATHPLCL
jgi:hypothetical protein